MANIVIVLKVIKPYRTHTGAYILFGSLEVEEDGVEYVEGEEENGEEGGGEVEEGSGATALGLGACRRTWKPNNNICAQLVRFSIKNS